MVQERLMTPEETAERLSMKPRTIREWLRNGKLRGVKAGKNWRVREEDLNEFIRNMPGVKE
ncbi:MAG: helix-turn-helix domain-containing protein [Armatimonadota bacterium]